MLRGYFFCDRLEYRAAVLSGFRAPGVKNAPRFTGRLQYNFFDTEVYSFVSYAGSYLGTKKILAIGGGKTFATALPEQNLFQIEGGGFLKGLKIAPIARYEQKAFTANVNAPKNESRVALGLNFYPIRKAENNFNIKCWWQRVALKTGYATNEFTVQMQVYYF
jgi:hypothetical protein